MSNNSLDEIFPTNSTEDLPITPLEQTKFSIFKGGSKVVLPEKNPITLEQLVKKVSSEEYQKIQQILMNAKKEIETLQKRYNEIFNDEENLILTDNIPELLASSNIKKQIDILKERRQEYKNKTDYITTSGIFKARNNSGFEEDSYTYLIPIDIDYNPSRDINKDVDFDILKKVLSELPYVVVAMKSISGKGLKALIRVPPGYFDPPIQYTICKDIIYPYLEVSWSAKLTAAMRKEYQITEKINIQIDPQQAVLSQPFFIPYDPTPYVNYNADYFLEVDYKDISHTSLLDNPDLAKPDSLTIANLLNKIKTVSHDRFREITKHSYILGVNHAIGNFGVDRRNTSAFSAQRNKIIQELKIAVRGNIALQNDKNFTRQYKGNPAAETFCIESFLAGIRAAPNSSSRKNLAKTAQAFANLAESVKTKDTIESQIVRIGDIYYQNIKTPQQDSTFAQELIVRKKDALIQDYGPGFLDLIPSYTKFVNIPRYVKPKRTIIEGPNKYYNLFEPLPYQPIEGEFPLWDKYIRHIFGEQYSLGMDYMRVLVQHPTQTLPILVLTSQERRTGKTTFANGLYDLLGGNSAIISPEDFESPFNSHYIHKNVICIEESKDNRLKNTEKLKNLSTGNIVHLNRKYSDIVEFRNTTRWIIMSNSEDKFAYVDHNEVRFWVRQIPSVSEKDLLPGRQYLEKLRKEAPHFMHYLLSTPIEYQYRDRAWFHPKDIQTQTLLKAVESNRSLLYQELENIIEEYFNSHMDDYLRFTHDNLKESFSDNREIRAAGPKRIAKVLIEELGAERHPAQNHREWLVNPWTPQSQKSGRPFVIKRDLTKYPYPDLEELEKKRIEELPFNIQQILN